LKAAKLAKPLYCKALRRAEPEELSRHIGVLTLRVRVSCGVTRPVGGALLQQSGCGKCCSDHNELVDSSWGRIAIRGIGGVSCAAALILALLSAHARAAVTATITAPNVSLPYSASSQTGSFEIYLQASGSPQPQVVSMQVELQLPSFSTITFTPNSNTTPTVHPYIFPNQSPSATVVNSGRTIEGADTEQGNFPTLTNGVGLLLVNYSIPAGASGYFPLTFVDYPNQSQFGNALFDTNLAQIPTTDQNGSITILPPTAYWRGSVDGNWSTDNLQTGVTNWTVDAAGATDAHIAPGASTDVLFVGSGAQNLTTTLGGNFSIKGLTFTSTATTPVAIGGGNTLTIGGDGVTVQSGSAAHSINSPIILGGSQTWQVNNATSAPLTVGGALTVPAGANLMKGGAGELIVAGAPTLGNGSSLTVNGGTLKFNLTTGPANIGTGVTATVAAGATLELAGTISALSSTTSATARVNVTNNSIAPGGGLLVSGTNQQVGAITGSGNLVLAGGSSLTANSIQQAAVIIAGSSGNIARLTIDASNSSGTSLNGVGNSGQTSSALFDVPSATGFFADAFGSGPSSSTSPTLDGPTIEATGTIGAIAPTGSVPEPSSWGLAVAAIGGCLFAWIVRKDRPPVFDIGRNRPRF
jgi:hypothetical protein